MTLKIHIAELKEFQQYSASHLIVPLNCISHLFEQDVKNQNAFFPLFKADQT